MTATSTTPSTTSSTASRSTSTAPRTAAGWAAGGYLALFVLGVFANFLALSPVVQPGDAAGTAAALHDSETSFRLGAVAFLGIFLIDVVVAWALWVLFRPVHRDLSLLSAWFRLTYTVVLGAALGFLYAALWLTGPPTRSARPTTTSSCWLCRPSNSLGSRAPPPSAPTSWCWACCCSRPAAHGGSPGCSWLPEPRTSSTPSRTCYWPTTRPPPTCSSASSPCRR